MHSLKKKGDSRNVPQSIDAKEERFSIECGETKTRVITTANKKKGYYVLSEPMSTQGKERPAHYWFSFVSDWLRKWREFSGQTHDEVNKKTKQCRITFDTRWKIALLRWGLFFLIVIVSLLFLIFFLDRPSA